MPVIIARSSPLRNVSATTSVALTTDRPGISRSGATGSSEFAVCSPLLPAARPTGQDRSQNARLNGLMQTAKLVNEIHLAISENAGLFYGIYENMRTFELIQ
jgi:hypothetical protein